jgi:hypothetical protein
MSSPDHSSHKWVLVLSNLAYLLPAGVAAFKMFKPTGRQMNKQDGTQLISLFVFITFFSSWSYHMCRADLSIRNDACVVQPEINTQGCAVCPNNSMSWIHALPGSGERMSFDLSKFIDHFLAIFTLFMVIIHVIPIAEKLRKLIMVVSMIWMILFLSGGNDFLAGLPALIGVILMMLFWFNIHHQSGKQFVSRNKVWSLAVLSVIAAFVFFKFDTEPYWLKHSLWHIMGAVAAALLISKTAGCYEDIDTSAVDIPPWMQNIFIVPDECKIYDRSGQRASATWNKNL